MCLCLHSVFSVYVYACLFACLYVHNTLISEYLIVIQTESLSESRLLYFKETVWPGISQYLKRFTYLEHGD